MSAQEKLGDEILIIAHNGFEQFGNSLFVCLQMEMNPEKNYQFVRGS